MESVEGPTPPKPKGLFPEKPTKTEEKAPTPGTFDISGLPNPWPDLGMTPEQTQQFWNTFMNMISKQINQEMQKAREAIKKIGEEYKE